MQNQRIDKIFLFYPYPKSGGCFRQLIRTIEVLRASGIKVYYFSAREFPLLNKENVIYYKFPLYFKKEIIFYFFFYLLAPLYILKIIKQNKIKDILVFNEEFSALAFLARFFCGAKIILIIEGFMGSFAKSKRFTFLIQFFLKIYGRIGINISDKILAVSEDLRNKIKKLYKSNKEINVFYNYPLSSEIKSAKNINLKESLKLDSDAFIVTSVGSLIMRKNTSYLIREFSKLKQTKMHLIIVGSGPEEESLKKLVNKLNIKEKVSFLGERKDSLNIIKSSNLLVLPTLHDDCPLVIVEALQLDTPVLASNRGGIPELLKYDELMFDISEENDLYDKLRMLEDYAYYKKIKEYCGLRKVIFNKNWESEILGLINEN
jgi:glycosyltransferase involved in cell wall biosynthesis